MKASEIDASTPLIKFIQYWMNAYKLHSVKPSSYQRLLTSLETLKGYSIAEKPIGEIIADDIQEYVNRLTAHGYSASTIKKQMRIVTAPLRHAASQHRIPIDPTAGVVLPSDSQVKKKERDVSAYNEEEQEAIKKILATHAKPGYVAIELILETGLRVGEALALNWRNIDFNRRTLRVCATVLRLDSKNKARVQEGAKSKSSNRVIPLSPRAMEILKELRANATKPWVFSGEDGERLSYAALRYQMKCVARDAGVDFRGIHVFRHTFATNCYYKGCDVKILSKLLGHASVSITYNVYIDLFGDALEEMRAITG